MIPTQEPPDVSGQTSPEERAARSIDDAREGLRRRAASEHAGQGAPREGPGAQDVNPYFGEREVMISHRVYESFADGLSALRDELVAAGVPARVGTKAQLLMALLHSAWPQSTDEAVDLMLEWQRVQAAPPPRRIA